MVYKKVVLVVDNPIRDLYGIVLLALYLADRNIKCYLVSMNTIYNNNAEEIWRISPDFVLLNYMRVNNQELIRKIIEADIEVGILDTEGGVLVSLESYKQTYMTDLKLANRIRVYFSWGKLLGNYLVEEGLLLIHQLRITGSPRFDFYSKPLSEIAQKQKKAFFNNDNPIVLINSNFPIANPQYQTQEAERKMLMDVFKIDAFEVDQMVSHQQTALTGFLKLTIELANQYPALNFLYRPHPFENEKVYSESFANLPNVLISKEGPVLNQISKSVCILHRSCSTAIEAQLIGKPAFSLKWIPCFREQPLSEAVSIECIDYKSLTANIDQVITGSFVLPPNIHTELDKVGADWFSRFDGNSHKRVGAEIVAILDTINKRANFNKISTFYREATHHTLTERIKGVFYLIFNLQSNWSLRQFFNGIPQEKDPAYKLALKERLLWMYTYLFNVNKRKVFYGVNGRTRIQKTLWKASGKYFSQQQVRTISDQILLIQDIVPTTIIVRDSCEKIDYSLGISDGNSIIVEKK